MFILGKIVCTVVHGASDETVHGARQLTVDPYAICVCVCISIIERYGGMEATYIALSSLISLYLNSLLGTF